MIRAGLRALRKMYELTRDLHDLRVLAASGIVGALGAGLLNPVLPLYLQARGLDLERIGLVFAVGSLLPMFLQPMLGALSDRFSRKRVLVIGGLSASLMVPLFALLRQPLVLGAALACKLILERSTTPVSSALVADCAPEGDRATTLGLLASAINLMFVGGLLASTLALGLLGTSGVFWVAGALFVVGSLALVGLRDQREAVPTIEARHSAWRVALLGLVAPVAYLRRQPRLAALFFYQLAFTFALDLFPIYLPLFVVKLGAPEASVGPLVAASWLVYALVQPIGGRLSDRAGRRKGIIYVGLAGMVVSSQLLALAAWLPRGIALATAVAAWVLMAIPDGLFRPSASALLIDTAPPEERGQFIGALGSAGTLANVIAPLCYGVIARRLGIGAAFLCASFALGLALVALAWVRESARSIPAAARTSEAA